MSERTRRQLLEGAAVAAAATVLAPPALASGRTAAAPARRAVIEDSPLPVGPGAPYGSYQSEIYVAGMSTGAKPIFTTNLSDLEAAAAKVLSPEARRHLLEEAGGSDAVRANAEALEQWRIVPRMFIDRDERGLGVDVLGVAMPAPIILGPIGRQNLAHRDGEGAVARAAAGLELTYVHSENASQPVEVVAAGAPQGSRWFALDWPGGANPDLARLTRAQLAGCTHLVLSPPQRGEGWDALGPIREAWDGPIVLGGVQSVPVARAAVRRGFDGIVVSNERGRRGSNPRGTIHRLPKIAGAVGDEIAVLFGAGVVTGTDVYRALALGAEAVLIGRPYVHGLAIGGENGVRHMLRTLLAELEITFGIAGIEDHRKLGPDALIRA